MSNEQKEPGSNKSKTQTRGTWLASGVGIGVALGAAMGIVQTQKDENK